jgi:hypothetical protein
MGFFGQNFCGVEANSNLSTKYAVQSRKSFSKYPFQAHLGIISALGFED